MKSIKLIVKHSDGAKSDIDTLHDVAKYPGIPGTGMSIPEMRRACRLLDAIEKLPRDADTIELTLEDADHDYLAGKIERFQFAYCDRHILDLVDRIQAAGPARTEA